MPAIRLRADEVQQLLLPRHPGTWRINEAAQGAARRLLKALLTQSSSTVAWAMTGSGMAHLLPQVARAVLL